MLVQIKKEYSKQTIQKTVFEKVNKEIKERN